MIWTGLFGKFPHVIDISTTRGMEARGKWFGRELKFLVQPALFFRLEGLAVQSPRTPPSGLFQLVDVSSAFGTPFPLIFA
jgi:hypothetical protein